MLSENQIDSIDQDILRALLNDARKSYLQIAKELGVSNSLVHQRVTRLKEQNIIEGEKLRINPKKLGFQTQAFAYLSLKEPVKDLKPAAKDLSKIPEVVECTHISGGKTLIIKIFAKDNDHLRSILYDKIHQIDGVVGTETFIAFETEFKREVPIG